MDELDRIDILRQRTGLGYAEAKQLLDEAGGDVVEALVRFENRQKEEGAAMRWEARGRAAWDRLVDLIRQGNITRVRIRREDRVLLDFPVTAGVASALLLPRLSALAAAACLVGRCSIEVERKEPSTKGSRSRLVPVEVD
ncbi:DUF4342 domain-containing protein [Limnochorda pilosa]|uniref:Ubiquitin-associated-domain-containing protein n=1 Tax=Limnochorda pilosa TaxID=1555112 RepID=A0A0K2SNB6_LIMPI|nr:DUF4342 domain-containing protein [Limnochorda pilosa]BAS28314.1 ubiquitin-associated- domain-containing protein [Limnochorda pilosa]